MQVLDEIEMLVIAGGIDRREDEWASELLGAISTRSPLLPEVASP